MSAFAPPLRRFSTVFALALWDALGWIVAPALLALARSASTATSGDWAGVMSFAGACAGLQLLIGATTRVYRRYLPGSYREARHLGVMVAVVGFVAGPVWVSGFGGYPRSLALTVPVVALFVILLPRLAIRTLRTILIRARQTKDAERVLVYGAGQGARILQRMLSDDLHAPYDIVGVVDDDPLKLGQQIGRARVLGAGADLERLASQNDVSTVILAVPSGPQALIRALSVRAERCGLSLLILPKVADIVGRTVGVHAVRRLEIADLLGRGQVTTDLRSIAGYLNGRVVLVTGAGGSIGAELAKQLSKLGPSSLVLLDRDESALHAVQLELYGNGLLDSRDMVLCDIRDQEALDRVFFEHRPEVVFHAAALKHLPMLESYPTEAWKTNVMGSLNVLEAADRHGVQRLVNISTDKAADPISVLGKSKRLAEELTASFAARTGRQYVSVRFGNVLGSRGSVLHSFYRQVETGGPVTVVHPEITRYFMTIPEACQLTIQAGAIGEAGEVLVLDMGEPVRILDLAKQIIRRSGRSVDIVYTGLRPGEKLHEVLFNGNEVPSPTRHRLISRVSVPAREPHTLRRMRPDEFLLLEELGRTT